MKITIKLNKEEAESFKNLKTMLVPNEAQDDIFLKSVFFMGLEQFHKNAIEMMKKYVSENEDKLREEGIDVDSLKTLRSNQEEPSTEETEDLALLLSSILSISISIDFSFSSSSALTLSGLGDYELVIFFDCPFIDFVYTLLLFF